MTNSMEGRVALVSGGGRGIGASIAIALATAGCDIAINYNRNADSAEETATAIRALGRQTFLFQASVGDNAACDALVTATVAEFGRLDIVICNAGIASSGRSLHETEAAEVEHLLQIHTLGAYYLTRAAMPHLLSSPRGDVIFVSSAATKSLPPLCGPYTMAKAATEAMAFTWAKELCRKNVHVNIVAPGLTVTDMGTKFAKAVNRMTIAELDDEMPFSHVCRPEEVAEIVTFLCSPANSYLSGERIYVDGACGP